MGAVELAVGPDTVVDDEVTAVSVVARLAWDAERRIEGVRSDSRALGSCNCICRPIVGL